jgi:hypothetical protein
MKNKPLLALSALLRWRKLGESIASTHYKRQSEELAKAESALKTAQTIALELVEQRSKVLGDHFIDLAKMGMVAQMEHEALQHIEHMNDGLATVKVAHDRAMVGYIKSRADSRVAEERCRRVFVDHCRKEEVTLSDRMAELAISHSRRQG